jgi:ribonuclease P protein component
MVSVIGCERAPGGRRSRIVAKRAESGSLPSSPSSHESLRNSRDFRRVLDDGARRRIGGIVVVGSPGRAGPPRVGLVVSRSCGSAVARNRIKRRLRSAARATELEPGIDYVIIANRQVADAPYEQLVGWLRRATSEQSDA